MSQMRDAMKALAADVRTAFSMLRDQSAETKADAKYKVKTEPNSSIPKWLLSLGNRMYSRMISPEKMVPARTPKGIAKRKMSESR